MGLSTIMTASAAVPQLTEAWSHSYPSIVSGSSVMTPTYSAFDSKGNLFVAGQFTTEFDFAGSTLEPIAASSYLLKYAPDGTELWGVSFAGAATVTALSVSDDDQVFVAGVLADEVEFGSLNGIPVIKEGMKMEGDFTTGLNASFIAKYSDNGNALIVETFIPASLPALTSTGMYYHEDGDEYFHINAIKAVGGKVYASATYTGETKCGDVTFAGSYMDPWGGVYFLNQAKSAVFSLDTSLKNCAEIASFGLKEPTVMVETSQSSRSASFYVDGDVVYVGFVGNGNMTLKADLSVRDFEFGTGLGAESDINEYGFVFAAVKGNKLSIEPKVYKTQTSEPYFLDNSIKGMKMHGAHMMVVGTSNDWIPGRVNVSATTGLNDVFALMLDGATLDLGASVAVSATSEARTLDKAYGFSLFGDDMYVATAVEAEDGTIASIGAAWINPSMIATAASAGSTGVATSGTKIFMGSCGADGTVSYTLYDTKGAAIDNVISENIVKVYPNPVVDVLNFSMPVDVTIYSVLGVEMKHADNVSSISVSELPAGQYIVKANGNAIHVLKK